MEHPDDYDLIRYARLGPEQRTAMTQVGEHLQRCPECAEELALITEWLASESEDLKVGGVTPTLLSEIVYRLAVRATHVIRFKPFEAIPATQPAYALAADGTKAPAPGWQHRATLYSEDPEVVLRIMHDPVAGKDFLQLTGTDQTLTQHVCVHLGDPPTDFFTDDRGIAEVTEVAIADPASLHWQVHLPDATFTLSPLELSRHLQQTAPETVLEAAGGHRIAATLVEDTEGITLRIRPLSIFGQSGFAKVHVVVSQSGGHWRSGEAISSRSTVSAQVQASEPIEIRLFLI